MATAQTTPEDSQLPGERGQDLQEMLREVGLAAEYWLPQLQEHLGITCAQALQHLEEKDLQSLQAQAQYPWEKRALEKLLHLSHSKSLSESQEAQAEMMNKQQKQAEQALQEMTGSLSARRQRQEEAMRSKEAELRQAMDIPKELGPLPQTSLKEVMENKQTQLHLTGGTLSRRQNLPDRELVRWASGGLALRGIYKTSSERGLMEKREELLSVPTEFLLSGPEQGPRMETKEFTSSEDESTFTQTIEKLGFSVTAAAKGGIWGNCMEAGTDNSKHSESQDTRSSHSQQSYFCSTRFNYVPLASCHFPVDQLQFSNAALQELHCIEGLLSQPAGPDTLFLLRGRAEAFFHRFGSHANQGPLHLGGIYWWKATAEGFQSEQLSEVKQQAAEALDSYVRGSYGGFGVQGAAGGDVSDSHSKAAFQKNTLQSLQTKVQLSTAQTGGPPEANGLIQWKAGLVASNQTWCVIDRGLELVPIWDIILSSQRSDFKDPIQVANCLKDCYAALNGLPPQIQDREELLSAGTEAKAFLENVKSWEVTDPEEQLKKLIEFMQMLNEKVKNYATCIHICLMDRDLQNFLVNTVEFCKNSSIYNTKFIKSQLRILLDPHIHQVTNFPQARSIMQWISESESVQEHNNISQFSDLINTIKESQNHLMELKAKSQFPEAVQEVQRRATDKVGGSLRCFLNYLQETKKPDIQVLLLCIAMGAGYHAVNKTFQYLLGCGELHFIMTEMQTAHKKYQQLKTICNYRAHAFLVLTGLTATTGGPAVSAEEKTQRLALIRQHMGQSLSEEVVQTLTRTGAENDWEHLEKELRLLIKLDWDYETTMTMLPMDEVGKQLQSLFHEKKQPHDPHNDENSKWEVTENEVLRELLQRLGLEYYYPKRMSRASFHLIYKTSVYNTQPCSEWDLPFYFLQKLQMLNYGLRYLVFKDAGNTENRVHSSDSNQENTTFDSFEEFLKDNFSPTSPSTISPRPHIHPMDIQMAILHCADDFARQYIFGKLAICQFALPLLIPNPCTSQIEFSLWSLRQIRKTWQESRTSANEKINYRNQEMCRVSTHIVSFIRVGNGFSASKSQIMNCLVSKRKHDVFFHRHCRGSSKHCLLMEGVVEICWFCPAGEDDDRFHKCLTFTNLHGDAKEHLEQLTFLQQISSLLVVLMSSSDDNKETEQILEILWKSSKPVIFLLDDKENPVNNISGPRVKIGLRNRNEAELTEDLATIIQFLLEQSDAALSLQACAQIARQQGFLIDEDQRDCKEAKEKAETLIALLKEISQVKEDFLPLQGQLWHRWCEKDRELYHLTEKECRSIEHHKSEIETEKQRIRHEQLTRAFPLNDLMRSILEILQEHTDIHTKVYFFQWMSVFLDNITAGHLKKLNKKKKTLWSRIKTEKQKVPKSKHLKDWEYEVEALSREINDCSLGVEQLLREVGQIYEALEEASSTKDKLFLCLPQIAADLMIAGVPIELMDGDASYVPLKWVAAVFDKVSQKLGDKRLFVLSVLGLQSSGKSTLLNALFGLQFTVSAGRCTRGAYMQLLRVEETFTEELGFDFVLVVDTEVLRAPELNNKSKNRDNELATFVIGLANLTLINIFGENPSEMQDILQIVVQAFLRMKQVKISPRCLFVHQNVGEVTAEDQTMEGRRRLEQRLDEMAATAAEQEQCSGVTRFSDVIKFDVNTHVCYFAHLWDGNPPMAPPNPRYSHNVQDLKSRILLTAQQESRGSIMKISDVKLRVQDLWRALVSENFIFSFRNTQEVVAMSKLETMYNSWTWELRNHVLGLQYKLMNQIQNGKNEIPMTEELHVPVTAKYEAIKQEFEKYFNEDSNSDILVQWKANFENKLISLKEQLTLESERKANEQIRFKKSQETLDNKKSSYKLELLNRSRELALTVNGKQLSENELRQKFNEVWQKWVSEVSSTLQPIPEPKIDVDAENILFQHFNKETNLVNILKENSGRKFQIDHDKHVQMNKGYFGFTKTLRSADIESIDVTTDRIVSRYEETITNIRKQQQDYDASHFHKILIIIEEEVKSAPTKERYMFTSRYKMDLSSSLFQSASREFKKMHKAFKRANDPVYYLERKKEDFFVSFKISCQGATSIKTFVDFLWNKLTPAVLTTIWELMVHDISGDIRATCSAFNQNRTNLEKHILISLAEEENFDNYWQYLHHPESFSRNYIESHIRRYCSDKGSEKVKEMLKLRLDEIKNTILSAIHKSTEIAKDKSSTVSQWLDLFCDQLSEKLILPRKDLVGIEHQEIKDKDFLKGAMSEALDPAMKTVEEKYLSKSVEEMVPEITEKLSEHLCGCWKKCPCCGAICTNTIPAHDGDHSVPFHRPGAIKGRAWHDETDNFTLSFCTSSAASNCSLAFAGGRVIPWKTYRQAGGEYATWSITPDSSSQPYWKWFVCHFRSELEERYKKKFAGRGEIPDAWTKITKQDVLNDLKR